MCMNYVIVVFFEISIDLRSEVVCISRSKRSKPYNPYSVYYLLLSQFSCGIGCYNLHIVPCFNQPFTNFFNMSFHSTYVRRITGTDLGYFQG